VGVFFSSFIFFPFLSLRSLSRHVVTMVGREDCSTFFPFWGGLSLLFFRPPPFLSLPPPFLDCYPGGRRRKGKPSPSLVTSFWGGNSRKSDRAVCLPFFFFFFLFLFQSSGRLKGTLSPLFLFSCLRVIFLLGQLCPSPSLGVFWVKNFSSFSFLSAHCIPAGIPLFLIFFSEWLIKGLRMATFHHAPPFCFFTKLAKTHFSFPLGFVLCCRRYKEPLPPSIFLFFPVRSSH